MNEINEREIKSGDILMTSWGYNMTINDYCKVLENTGKTLKCVMVSSRVENDNGLGEGRSSPLPELEISEPFRIKISKRGIYVSLVGSYPYVMGRNNKRKGYWHTWDGKPNYYNTRD